MKEKEITDISQSSPSSQENDEETNISDIIGPWGPWQRNMFVYFFFGAMASCWHSLGLSFYAPKIDFWCETPDSYSNLTIDEPKDLIVYSQTQTQQCLLTNSTESCESWEYDHSFYSRTIISEWNLVCGRSGLVSATQSAYMIGVMVTVIVTGQLSDKLGRLPIVWGGLIIELFAGISCAFSSSVWHFMISRFALAFGASARWSTVLEVVGPQYRDIVGMAIEFGWALGYIVLPGVAYLLRDFRFLQLACTIPECLLLLWWWSLPESPRWQLINGKYTEAEKTIRSAAEINRRPTEKLESQLKKLKDKTLAETKKMEANKSASLLDLFKTRTVFKNTLILYFSWFVNAFVYYGLSLNTNNLGGDPFINFLISGAVEFPAYALCIYVLRKFGRRLPLSVAMFGGGFGCLLTVPFMSDHYLWLRITFAMIGKFCVTCSFGMIYVYSAEIFPTVVRNVGVGSSSMVGRVGSIIAPFVKELGIYTHATIPLAIFGIISVTDGILILLLPETKEEDIPDTIDDAENFLRLKKKNKINESELQLSTISNGN